MSTVNELRHLHFLLTTDRVDDAMKIMRFSDDPTLRAFSEQFHDGTLSVADIRACIETRQADGPQSPRSFVRMPVPVSPARVQSVPVDTAPPVEVVSPLQPLHPVEATPDDQHPPEIIIALSPSDVLAPPADTAPPVEIVSSPKPIQHIEATPDDGHPLEIVIALDPSEAFSPPLTHPPGTGYAPMSPVSIIGLSLLAGFLFNFVSFSWMGGMFGIVLAAQDWRRLGKSHLFVPSLVVATIGLLLPIAATVALVVVRTVNDHCLFVVLAGLIPSLVLLGWQIPTRREWMRQYGAQRAALKQSGGPLILAQVLFALVVADFIIYGTMLTLAEPLSTWTATLFSDRTFENADLRLTYPGGWVVVQPEDYTAEGREFCNQSGVTCQVVLARPGGVIELQVTDYTGLSLLLMTAGAFDETIRDQRTAAGAEVIRQQALQINGREVSRTVLLMPDQSVRSYTVVKPQPTTITVISFYAPDSVTYLRLKPDVDAIFASMEFITPE